jgi:hypothetical protein
VSDGGRELLLGILLLVVASAGGAIEVAAEQRVPLPTEPSVLGGIVERAAFCPPAPAHEIEAATMLAVASGSGGPTRVGIEPQAERGVKLGRNRLLTRALKDGAAAVTGLGEPVVANVMATVSEPLGGAWAAACSQLASSEWYFPEGSTVLGADERLLVYNPFPDEAVVRVTLFTPAGRQDKANLADVAVPSGESVELALNDFIRIEPIVSASVVANRGRVVAWRQSSVKRKNGPSGVHMTLGAPALAETWYFPEGGVGAGFDEEFAVLNPSEEEAQVTISLATSDKVLQPPKLVEVAIPPLTAKSFSLDESLRAPDQPRAVSALVSSTNGVDVAAERSVTYTSEGEVGIASEVGARATASRWLLGPATSTPGSDYVSIMNPSSKDVITSITLVRSDGSVLRPRQLRRVKVPAGLARRLSVGGMTRGRPVAALVRASGEVVAERLSYSSVGTDPASRMGSPITRSAPPT